MTNYNAGKEVTAMWIDKLADLKKRSGKTTKQISEESGVPIGTLNKLFAGQTQDPKLETVRSVVHSLGYTLDDVLTEQRTPAPPGGEAGVLTVQELKRISAAMAQMNEEGRERVVEYAEDLAAGGRYKKTGADSLGKEA